MLFLNREVLCPVLRAWIEEEAEPFCLRVEGTEITPLVAIATPASERQVIGLGRAAMLFGNHMIDFMREEGEIGEEQTVFAAISGAINDLASQRHRDIRNSPRAPVRC